MPEFWKRSYASDTTMAVSDLHHGVRVMNLRRSSWTPIKPLVQPILSFPWPSYNHLKLAVELLSLIELESVHCGFHILC